MAYRCNNKDTHQVGSIQDSAGQRENALAATLKDGSVALCNISVENGEAPKKRRKRDLLDETSDEELAQVIKDITGKTPEEHDTEFAKINTRIKNLKKEKEEMETKNKQDIFDLIQKIEVLRTTAADDNSKQEEDIAHMKKELLYMGDRMLGTKKNLR